NQKHAKESYHSQYTMNSTNHVKKMTDLSLKYDWRDRGIIGPVRNQESCKAWWAFNIIGIVESMYAIETGTLYSLSVQELIDCVLDYGCTNGGNIHNALLLLMIRNTTIVSENAYPLTWKTDACKLSEVSAETLRVAITNFEYKSYVDREYYLLNRLVNHGPVAYVNAINWQNYRSGIIDYNCDDSIFNMNHAVQIVGYDTMGMIPYYIVKSSWGSNFGENGYLRLAMNKNICGKINYERRACDIQLNRSSISADE
ncbi:cathepsin O-like, partial [Linepithema humile]|uniref:cathepsin O-like n=1 Tax=Linepithema humile TaxID=83485 RepID=UPI00351F7AD8